MSYSDFSVDGIDYRLLLTTHLFSKAPIEGIDALVTETGYTDPTLKEAVVRRPDMRNYVGYLSENDIPVYTVDNHGKYHEGLKRWIDKGNMLLHELTLPLAASGATVLSGYDWGTAEDVFTIGTLLRLAIMLAPAFPNNKTTKFFSKTNSFISSINQSPNIELRNALAARKIKYGVVPHVIEKDPEKFKDRNPKIGVLYGAGHSSIKECLESDRRTNFTLKLHSHYGIPLILDKKSLNDIYEYHILPGKPTDEEVTKHMEKHEIPNEKKEYLSQLPRSLFFPDEMVTYQKFSPSLIGSEKPVIPYTQA